jgi:hypothetical protein
MKRIVGLFFVAIALYLALATDFVSAASEPGWSPNVIARGEERQQIRATPIEQRPYRPLHFYGNTVRRIHYRGTPLPAVGETAAMPVRAVRGR